jgi:hypothetical protein
MKKLLIAAAVAALLAAALWLPGSAQQEAQITASVTVQNVAVSVSPTAVNYGTLAFETTQRSGDANAPFFTATNNGNVNVDLKVRGADATFTGGGWAIQQGALDCVTPVLNTYRHSVIGATGGVDDAEIFMTTSNSSSNLVSALAPGASKGFNSKIYMPCAGSSGLGETATTSITVVALASP